MIRLNVQEVAHRLVELGLSKGEANAYVHLTRLGRCKVSELSRRLDIGRSDTYHILHRLVERGFATTTIEKPARFEAQTPERVFARLHDDSQARVDGVERARVEIAPILVTLGRIPEPPLPSGRLDLVHGRAEVRAGMRDLLQRAERRVELVCLVAAPEGLIGGIESMVAPAIERGIEIRAILHDAPPMEAWARTQPGLRARFVPPERPVQFVVRDGVEELMVIERDERASLAAAGDVAIVTSATLHVAAQLALFDELWARGRDAKRG